MPASKFCQAVTVADVLHNQTDDDDDAKAWP